MSKAQLDGKRILVVDDNKDAAESLGMLLKLLGGQVRTVNDGPTALALLEEFQPDFVLLDIGMPKMDGYEVAKRIRSRSIGARMRIVAVSGWGQEEDRKLTSQAGFDAHLVKPISLKALEKILGVQ